MSFAAKNKSTLLINNPFGKFCGSTKNVCAMGFNQFVFSVSRTVVSVKSLSSFAVSLRIIASLVETYSAEWESNTPLADHFVSATATVAATLSKLLSVILRRLSPVLNTPSFKNTSPAICPFLSVLIIPLAAPREYFEARVIDAVAALVAPVIVFPVANTWVTSPISSSIISLSPIVIPFAAP